jgi:TRAP-type C4-dicarboxylate transport system permease small subunit
MDAEFILNSFQMNRVADALTFIGCILAIWLALRTANMTGENPSSNLVTKILSTVFGLSIVAGSFQAFAIAANNWVITARRITEMGVENAPDPRGAQGFLDFVGTTEPAGMPDTIGLIFLVTVAIMIIGLIWLPRK